MNPLIWIVIGIILIFVFGQILISLATAKKERLLGLNKTVWFYLVLFSPFIISIVYRLIQGEKILLFSDLVGIILLFVLVILLIGWAIALIELASDRRFVGFYVMLLFFPIAPIFYWLFQVGRR